MASQETRKDEYEPTVEDMVKDHERCINEFKRNIAHIFKCFDEMHKCIKALEARVEALEKPKKKAKK